MIRDRRKYSKKYYQLHQEERKKYRRDYYKEHKEEQRKRTQDYYEKHREEILQNHKNNRERLRTYSRNHTLDLKGKEIRNIIKRPYTGYCEICGKVVGEEIKQLDYHHWDDNDLKAGLEVKGIWICWRCHRLCEAVDKDELHFIQRYLRLKRAISKEWKIKKQIRPELN